MNFDSILEVRRPMPNLCAYSICNEQSEQDDVGCGSAGLCVVYMTTGHMCARGVLAA